MAVLCLPTPTSTPTPVADVREDSDLRVRIQAEFCEMPGLTLTLPQAARLFSLDQARCERILLALVRTGLLRTDGPSFARADVGRRNA
jgi:hypothetical protein